MFMSSVFIARAFCGRPSGLIASLITESILRPGFGPVRYNWVVFYLVQV